MLALILGCQENSRGLAVEDPDMGVPALPALTITDPPDHAPHVRRTLILRGTSLGAERVSVVAEGQPPVVAAGTDSWEATVRLVPGTHVVRVLAQGLGGDIEAERTVHQGDLMTLTQPQPGTAEVELRLDRLALERILSPADQAKIPIAYLDLAPLVGNALAALSDPEAWGVDTTSWGDAEWNLAALLTIGPDSANLAGTALFPLLDLSARLGLAQPKVLADLLEIEPTDPFLDPDLLTESLLDLVVRSHPNFDGDARGRMAVTLFDALGDLAPLADQYGPSGDHPGFMAAPPRADLFTPAFAMVVSGHGTVTTRPGLRPGEGYAAHLVKPPLGTPLIELDFSDPRRFRVEGLHPEPRVALTMNLAESPDYFSVPDPGSPPRGNSAVWTADPWVLERLVAEAGYRAFATRFPAPRTLSYDLGAVRDAAQVRWRDGFIDIEVVANLGPPPPPAYLWDLMLDVAQARLHDGGLAEGDVDLQLALPLLPVGLDDEALIAAMRPELEARKDTLVALMVGRPEDLESRATFFLDTDALVATEGGFFSDSGLDGERLDEIPLAPGTWWVRSPDNKRYALIIEDYTDGRLSVGMVRVPGAPGEGVP